MLQRIKKALLFVLLLLPIAAVGGYFAGIYGWEGLTEEMKAMVLEQIPDVTLYCMITMIQTISYAAIFGFFGYFLAEKIGLMGPISLKKVGLVPTGIWAVISGGVLSLDRLLFGKQIPQVAALYESKPSVSNWIASVLYGGVIEEVMIRLFFMSLIVFLVWKLLYVKREEIPKGAFVFANIMASLLFAAGHIPATIQMFGELTPLILFRCFLLNGMAGLGFGYLYRKHGIQYAMLGHMGAHIVWKLLWVIFM